MFGFPSVPTLGMGLSTIIWAIVSIAVAVLVWRERKGFVTGTPIVLKKFRLSEDTQATTALEIVGRAAGILSWLLNLLRLEQDYVLVVTSTEVSIQRGSLSGVVHAYLPLKKVTATICGYQRSIFAFGLAIIFGVGFISNLLSGLFENNRNEVGADMGLAFGFLILAGGAVAAYFLSQRIGINIETERKYGFVFKRSVIENVSVDFPEALRAIAIVNSRVLAAQSAYPSPGQSSTAPTASQLPPKPLTPMPSTIKNEPAYCSHCSTLNPAGTRFCENCGLALA